MGTDTGAHIYTLNSWSFLHEIENTNLLCLLCSGGGGESREKTA